MSREIFDLPPYSEIWKDTKKRTPLSKERELLKRFMIELTTEEDVVSLFNDIKECLAEPELLEEAHQKYNKPRCCICKTTENVKYVGGYQAYRCPSPDCVPF